MLGVVLLRVLDASLLRVPGLLLAFLERIVGHNLLRPQAKQAKGCQEESTQCTPPRASRGQGTAQTIKRRCVHGKVAPARDGRARPSRVCPTTLPRACVLYAR